MQFEAPYVDKVSGDGSECMSLLQFPMRRDIWMRQSNLTNRPIMTGSAYSYRNYMTFLHLTDLAITTLIGIRWISAPLKGFCGIAMMDSWNCRIQRLKSKSRTMQENYRKQVTGMMTWPLVGTVVITK